MKDENLQELTKELRNITVQVPLHQKALRAQLLSTYTRPQPVPRFRETLRQPAATARRRKQVGVTLTLLSALILGIFILRPAMAENSAQQLALVAAYRVQHMPPAKLTLISRDYEALDECLQEALRSKSLHVATGQEANMLLRHNPNQAYPAAEVYLVFTDRNSHRIIIGLDAAHAPLYAVDADKNKVGNGKQL